MAEPFLAEIMIVGFNFAPRGWAFCDGQILPINQNQSLYSLLGTTYGGDGRTTFALPDLRGRTPMHTGTSFNQGQKGGEETHSLSVAETPSHTHVLRATNEDQTSDDPTGNLLASPPSINIYDDLSNPANMNPATVGNTGVGQGHNNMAPYLVLNFCIALQGTFPSRN